MKIELKNWDYVITIEADNSVFPGICDLGRVFDFDGQFFADEGTW